MNKSNKIKTYALAILAVISGVGTAFANDSKENHSSLYLTAGLESNFELYMNKSAKRFTKKHNEEWSTFNKIVNLYNQSQGQFQNLSEANKAAFNDSVEAINKQLAKKKNKDAKEWLKKVDLTEKVFNFLWDSKVKEMPLNDQFISPPPVLTTKTIG